MRQAILEPGDVVKLKTDYQPAAASTVCTHGIVGEISARENPRSLNWVDTEFGIEAGEPDTVPTQVALWGYNPSSGEKAGTIPTLSDTSGSPIAFQASVRELILIRQETETYTAQEIDLERLLSEPSYRADLPPSLP